MWLLCCGNAAIFRIIIDKLYREFKSLGVNDNKELRNAISKEIKNMRNHDYVKNKYMLSFLYFLAFQISQEYIVDVLIEACLMQMPQDHLLDFRLDFVLFPQLPQQVF